MLTQKIWPGHGAVHIHGRSMVIGDRSSFKQVGYCPQFDALNMKLTTNENMELFARIRGIPEPYIKPLISRLLVSLHLSPYASTITSALSGGNRRKLSVAIALISHPSLVLLDEPSAGMDPGSQQFLWRVIDQLRKSGKAVDEPSAGMDPGSQQFLWRVIDQLRKSGKAVSSWRKPTVEQLSALQLIFTKKPVEN
ncbi:ABC transporter, ATP-binding protein [Oesophagostomum dentatum]|uniref:ABC transporter, ATP-binding protein n=1 Tax=Oesophagostomum dentatum TaxID=61180 RepID=A0A0B1SCZ2_OESDE|nr:ABC transporter, ATP-binding protein [Oesophagostomum dentatum]